MFHVKPFFLILLIFPFGLYAQTMGFTTLENHPLPPMPVKDEIVLSTLESNEHYPLLTDDEKEWFYWTNYSRKNPRKFWDSVVFPLTATFPPLRNSFSASLKRDLYRLSSLPFVLPLASLSTSASGLAKELSSKKATPSHTSPSGKTFQQRMEKAGIQYCAGENLSYGPWPVVLMLTLLYIDEGVPDLGHRQALLNPSFVHMGIGVGLYADNYKLVVQDFSCAQ